MSVYPRIDRILNRYWGEFFFVFYLVMAICFAKERILFLDNAFQLFLLIQEDHISVNANRWPAISNRVIPYLLSQLHVGLGTIIKAFSLNYVLVQYLAFYIVRWLFRDETSGVVLILLLSLPVVHGFFWCNSELVLALCMLICCHSAFKTERKFSAILFATLAVWLHPLAIVAMALILLVAILEDKRNFTRYIPAGMTALVNYLIKEFCFANWYDRIKKNEFQVNWKQYDIVENQFAFKVVSNLDLVIIAAFIICLVYNILNRRFLIALSIAVIGYFMLIIQDIGNAYTLKHLNFYDEVNSYIIFFFSLVGLYTFFSKMHSKNLPLLITAVIFYSGFRWIHKSSFYTNRIEWYSSLISQNDRTIWDARTLNAETLVLPWASAYESLLISTLDNHTQTILITSQPETYMNIDAGDRFLSEFRNYALDSLDHSYFKLEEKAYRFKYLD